MTIRLAVQEAPGVAHVQSTARSYPGLVPVVKGNGYGFRRWNLVPLAGQLAEEIAVGTVFEIRGVPDHVTPIVLTPTMVPPSRNLPDRAVLTVATPHHLVTLDNAGWKGRVIVKLRSSMMRYGATVDTLTALVRDIASAGLTVHGYAIHPPLAGDDRVRLKDITDWLPRINPDIPVYVSHLSPEAYAHLRSSFADRTFRYRSGTQLWLGDKSMMQLSADVLGHHPVEPGQTAGYRQVPITSPGEIVMVGCGSAHGVGILSEGRSPFHYQRQRLNLLEPPHMHTSMLFVARGRPIPPVGEWIDVQQALTQVQVDVLQWLK